MGFKHSAQLSLLWFTSTILDDIQHQVVFFTLSAAMVCAVCEKTSTNLGINNIMIAVLGGLVSLTVSFKTNSAYTRWWEGRNIWANVSSNSRHLAMLIWLHVPNAKAPPKEDPKPEKSKSKHKRKSKKSHHNSSRQSLASMASPNPTSDPDKIEILKGFTMTDTPPRTTPVKFDTTVTSGFNEKAEIRPSGRDTPASMSDSMRSCATGDFTGSTGVEGGHGHKEGAVCKGVDHVLTKQEEIKMRLHVAGMVEKKTFIGLVQAFGVAMKHALRGEAGPFYTDLYHLIAFLPKYNTSVVPPVTRTHLFPGWENGIPRQKADYDDDSIAVPLTNPAPFTGYAFEIPSADADSDMPPINVDEEKLSGTAFTTTSYQFRDQALNSATAYIRSEGESRRHCFARLDKKHRVVRRSEDKQIDRVPVITVELMPPRHPPKAQYWDFFPPLRLIKVVTDWIRRRELVQKQERVRGGKRKRNGSVKCEIPQEIIMYLSAYMDDLVRRDLLNTSYIGSLMNCILEFQKAMTDLDKIASTPIPSAYSFHLRLTVWGFLLFLPFQLYPLLRWITIPAVSIAAITYLGFLEIGAQIEMPFGYDQSDLDLDKFVLKIAHQLAEVTSFPCDVSSSQIILSQLNQPFYPALHQSAPELSGVAETKPCPNPLGFSAVFEACKDKDVPDLSIPSKAYKEAKAKSKREKAKSRRSDHHSSDSSSSSSSSESDDSVSGKDTEEEKENQAKEVLENNKHLKPISKSIRDLELALAENWRIISTETEAFIGKPRQQLENRSGIEVAVMTL